MKRLNIFTIISALLFFLTACAQEHKVTFKINMKGVATNGNIELFGNERPLSWDKGILLSDVDKDSIYEVTTDIKTSSKNVKFKFANDGKRELDGGDNRMLWYKSDNNPETFVFNEYPFYETEKVDSFVFTKEQISEDVTTLKEILTYIHPAIYRYRDSLMLQSDFKKLENTFRSKRTLKDVYLEISRLLSLIKCSHTFLNPWNQGTRVENSFFHQPDKIPLTFNRIGQQLFIDKNASENSSLKRGLEILSINGIKSTKVLTQLAKYVTSDGSNFEKKLSRLEIDGTAKFAFFDIYFPMEFGGSEVYTLQLKDWETDEISEVKLKSISKSKRTAILQDRYGNFETNLKDGWKFEISDTLTAVLTIKSFAVQEKNFEWEDFLDNAFAKANTKKVKNLIIDIRGNEGGDGAVGQYILERINQQTIELPGMQAAVRYKNIPESFKEHINTWDKIPYDWSQKIETERGGHYILKEKYGIPSTTYKPRKDGFKGKVFLITNAANSSATHLMATYAKMLDNVTLVGQETGGNKLGINGSYIFFLKLPNSKIVIDVPVIAQQVKLPKVALTDSGIAPDILVKTITSDFINGTDVEMDAIIKLINQN